MQHFNNYKQLNVFEYKRIKKSIRNNGFVKHLQRGENLS